ncbi:MAG TPA: magnesium/cobalt transporter CorA [Phycisphaerales bacterium]|nr:magnesium/cobalt transporter CorA [Phycisphaerales bacterium]
MSKKRKKSKLYTPAAQKAGLPPGTPVYIGDRTGQPIRITRIVYEADRLDEHIIEHADECFKHPPSSGVMWLNIDGVHDVSLAERIGKHIGLHPLTLEDIVHPGQRPKYEEYDSYLFIVLRMLQYTADNAAVTGEQVSLILRDNILITFQESVGDVFEQIRQRLRTGKGRIRNAGADYLAYALIDAVVDHYFVILETMGERIEDIEERLLTAPDDATLHSIHYLKRELMLLRKSVWPLRELLSALQRTDSPLIQPPTRVYLRDVYDHAVQILDIIESFRDVVSGMLDIYLSSLSNRMNAAMKVLTIIATVFIPLSFITGIFGMNFEHFPELTWRWAYPWGFWGIILASVCVLLYVFRKNKWL